MIKPLLSLGGPNSACQHSANEYSLRVPIPTDADGRTARACPNKACSPGYFKVLGGTGIAEPQTAFCPYCRYEDRPIAFTTNEQYRYARDITTREVTTGFERMLKNALGLDHRGTRKLGGGLLSIDMSLTSSPPSPVRRPWEDEVRRDVVCPQCGLDQSVYGLATWCADCSADIFLTHVEAEIGVVRAMLTDIPRRRETLGRRTAAKDLENCLEDAVSIFEAVLKAMVHRHQHIMATSSEDAECQDKRIGNGFQNISRAGALAQKELGIDLFEVLSAEKVEQLAQIFAKRHPITHNLGVVDRKYLEKVRTAEHEGREVLVTAQEIDEVLELTLVIFRSAHGRLFPEPDVTTMGKVTTGSQSDIKSTWAHANPVEEIERMKPR